MGETDKSEIVGTRYFSDLPKLQVNRHHQKPDKPDAHNKADLTEYLNSSLALSTSASVRLTASSPGPSSAEKCFG